MLLEGSLFSSQSKTAGRWRAEEAGELIEGGKSPTLLRRRGRGEVGGPHGGAGIRDASCELRRRVAGFGESRALSAVVVDLLELLLPLRRKAASFSALLRTPANEDLARQYCIYVASRRALRMSSSEQSHSSTKR